MNTCTSADLFAIYVLLFMSKRLYISHFRYFNAVPTHPLSSCSQVTSSQVEASSEFRLPYRPEPHIPQTCQITVAGLIICIAGFRALSNEISKIRPSFALIPHSSSLFILRDLTLCRNLNSIQVVPIDYFLAKPLITAVTTSITLARLIPSLMVPWHKVVIGTH